MLWEHCAQFLLHNLVSRNTKDIDDVAKNKSGQKRVPALRSQGRWIPRQDPRSACMLKHS